MDPPDPTWESFEILLLHVLSNDAWQFTINLFPSAEGHLKMLIYHFFLFKMQIWNDCNALNIAGYPIKDINVNLSFLSFGSKVVEWTPPDPTWKCFEIVLLHVLSNDAWQFTINLFSISWGPLENVNLPFFYWKCKFEMVVMHLI